MGKSVASTNQLHFFLPWLFRTHSIPVIKYSHENAWIINQICKWLQYVSIIKMFSSIITLYWWLLLLCWCLWRACCCCWWWWWCGRRGWDCGHGDTRVGGCVGGILAPASRPPLVRPPTRPSVHTRWGDAVTPAAVGGKEESRWVNFTPLQILLGYMWWCAQSRPTVLLMHP